MCAAVFVATARPAHAGINVWTSHGPGVAFVTALAIDPTRPGTLYAATGACRGRSGCGGNGLYKSTDGGDTWNAANTGLPDNTSINALAIGDRTTPSTLYAGTYGGDRGGNGVIDAGIVYKSTDGTTSWQAVNAGLPDNTSVTALAMDPTTPSTLYAGTYDGVYKSTDGASSWNAANTGLAGLPDNNSVTALAMDPTTSSTLYAATYYGVYKSTDGASSWQAFNAGLSNTSVLALAIARTTPSTLYAGTDGGGVFAIEQISVCVGDCNYDGTVAVDDLLTMVNIALGDATVSECLAGAGNGDGAITVGEILTAVDNVLNGCAPF